LETHYYENGHKQWEVTWASGRRTGEETLWASDGTKFWSWNHDLKSSVSTWTHWWSNGQKKLESQWDTNPTAHDLPTRHFRGLVANGTARHWDAAGRELATYTFLNGKMESYAFQSAKASPPGELTYELFGDTELQRSQGSGSATEIGPMDKGNGDWGLRFSGVATPPVTGEYVLRAEADTGVRVKINGNLVIDGWAKGGARSGKTTLSKGKPVSLVVEYFFDRAKGGAKAALRLFWTPPGGQEAPVPVAGGKTDG
jgi:antitoxin component YwqK of YwqJK toxin-antitoxin module